MHLPECQARAGLWHLSQAWDVGEGGLPAAKNKRAGRGHVSTLLWGPQQQ